MNNTSLPTETVANIIEEVISECAVADHKDSYQRFVPRWYFIPLLRVCKLWYAVCAKYLYESIAVGSDAPFNFPVREGESYYAWINRRQVYVRQATHQIRKGHEVAEDLDRTLATNSRLAASIRKLQLGTEIVCHPPKYPSTLPSAIHKPEWTQTNIRILQLCPNVEYVEICGFEGSELEALVDVLKKKSLVSFCISTRYLSVARWGKGGSFWQLVDMLQKWPKIRSIRVDGFLNNERTEDPVVLDTSQISGCCPDLREIVITRSGVHTNELIALRAMCSGGVAKLDISLYGRRAGNDGRAAVDALSECLCAWSSTLDHLKTGVFNYGILNHTLDDALGTLGELRELQLDTLKLDYGSISRLPRLKRLVCRSLHGEEELHTLSNHLGDSQKFPSLNLIALQYGWEFPTELQNMCHRRNIRLERSYSGDSLPFLSMLVISPGLVV